MPLTWAAINIIDYWALIYEPLLASSERICIPCMGLWQIAIWKQKKASLFWYPWAFEMGDVDSLACWSCNSWLYGVQRRVWPSTLFRRSYNISPSTERESWCFNTLSPRFQSMLNGSPLDWWPISGVNTLIFSSQTSSRACQYADAGSLKLATTFNKTSYPPPVFMLLHIP